MSCSVFFEKLIVACVNVGPFGGLASLTRRGIALEMHANERLGARVAGSDFGASDKPSRLLAVTSAY